jgi:hypothetical protein
MFGVHSEATVSTVLGLVASGLNDCEISRTTGLPRSTVRDWRVGKVPTRDRGRCEICDGGRPILPETAYAYLLGMYLGDGCISRHPRAFRLRITLDSKYPGIIDECAAALRAIRPNHPVWIGTHGRGCAEVSMYFGHWPCFFPQHGPGRKHHRVIELVPWQTAIVAGNHKALIRGLIHSDGCRVVANDRGVESIRYHFSNLSDGVRKIYTESLDALGIPWTQPSHRDIAVYRKRATEFLDEFVGPKQ